MQGGIDAITSRKCLSLQIERRNVPKWMHLGPINSMIGKNRYSTRASVFTIGAQLNLLFGRSGGGDCVYISRWTRESTKNKTRTSIRSTLLRWCIHNEKTKWSCSRSGRGHVLRIASRQLKCNDERDGSVGYSALGWLISLSPGSLPKFVVTFDAASVLSPEHGCIMR
jgi:hypothetical protein